MSYYPSSPLESLVLGAWLFLFVVTTWRRFDWAVSITLFLLPAYLIRFSLPFPFTGLGAAPTTLLETHIYILFFVWAVRSVRNTHSIREMRMPALSFRGVLNSFWTPFGLILLGGAISTLLTPYTLKSLGIFKGFLFDPMLFLWVLWCSGYRVPEKIRTLFIVLSFSGIAVALVSLGYIFVGEFTYDGRLRAFYNSPNYLAMYLAPLFLITIYQAVTHTKKAQFFFWGGVGVIAFVLYRTFSYGAWLGLLGAFGFLGTAYLRQTKQRLYGSRGIRASLILLFFMGVFVLAALLAASKLQNSVDAPLRSSLESRKMVWRASKEILKDHPYFGIGMGTFQEHYLEYQKEFDTPYLEWAVPHPHNVFLAFWLETGLLGLFGFLWATLRACVTTGSAIIKNRHGGRLKEIYMVAGAILVLFLVHGFIDTPVLKNDLMVVWGGVLLWTATHAIVGATHGLCEYTDSP